MGKLQRLCLTRLPFVQTSASTARAKIAEHLYIVRTPFIRLTAHPGRGLDRLWYPLTVPPSYVTIWPPGSSRLPAGAALAKSVGLRFTARFSREPVTLPNELYHIRTGCSWHWLTSDFLVISGGSPQTKYGYRPCNQCDSLF